VLRATACVLLLALALTGCAKPPVAAPRTPRTPPVPLLRDASAQSAVEASRVASFARENGYPGTWHGVPPQGWQWPRLSARDVPRRFVPADTLGNGLLIALAASSSGTTSTPADPLVDIHMLFQGGLTLSATTTYDAYGAPPTLARWNAMALRQVRTPDSGYYSARETTTVGSGLAIVLVSRRGPVRTSVDWQALPWFFSLRLDGNRVPEALRVARSVGK
jgi:hypothetical protein